MRLNNKRARGGVDVEQNALARRRQTEAVARHVDDDRRRVHAATGQMVVNFRLIADFPSLAPAAIHAAHAIAVRLGAGRATSRESFRRAAASRIITRPSAIPGIPATIR